MNKLYVTSRDSICLDDNQNIIQLASTRAAINRIWLIKEDTQVTYLDAKKNTTEVRICSAGDIVIEFYEKDFPNKLVVIDNKEWKENLEALEAEELRIKEEWALKQKENEENKGTDCGYDCKSC